MPQQLTVNESCGSRATGDNHLYSSFLGHNILQRGSISLRLYVATLSNVINFNLRRVYVELVLAAAPFCCCDRKYPTPLLVSIYNFKE
jgi:hypothetical protein